MDRLMLVCLDLGKAGRVVEEGEGEGEMGLRL